MTTSAKTLSPRQSTVLRTLKHNKMTAAQIGVRSDVLWRLEHLGLVARNLHEVWYLTREGRELVGEIENELEG